MPEAADCSGRVRLTVADAGAWRTWLDEHEDGSDGVWLTLAKKGAHAPTSLTYREALDEALCSEWIDGRKNSIDGATFRQHFTPRRRRSLWSARNVELVAALTAAGRMRDRGRAEVDRARADGRWDRAYAGAATIEVPADLLEALQASPTAAHLDALAITFTLEGPLDSLFTKATVELADRDPEVAEAARCAYRRLEDEYAGCIEQAQTAGEVDAALDARALATYFVAVTRGMEVLGTAGADRSVLLGVGRAAFTLLT